MWIKVGEKYALVGLNVKIDEQLPLERITPNLWVLADTTFDVPPHWQEWLGSIRAREVENCNLFLLSKLASHTADVLDAENQQLQDAFGNSTLVHCSQARLHRRTGRSCLRVRGETEK